MPCIAYLELYNPPHESNIHFERQRTMGRRSSQITIILLPHFLQNQLLQIVRFGAGMIRAVLSDNNVVARRQMRQFLRQEPAVVVVGECATANETIELVRATLPDLVFLDTGITDEGGFDLVDAIMASDCVIFPNVIFTSAYEEFAARAFQVRAVDYLVKPFTSERLHSAVQRAIEWTRVPEINNGLGNVNTGTGVPYLKRLVFKTRGKILFLPALDIRWIASEENYVRIHTGKETHLLRETMTNLEKRLDPEIFLRVHRSSIVNLEYVEEVRSAPDGDVLLVNGERIPMSRSYRSYINKWLIRGCKRTSSSRISNESTQPGKES
jgi:two-component system LytT family response regulator